MAASLCRHRPLAPNRFSSLAPLFLLLLCGSTGRAEEPATLVRAVNLGGPALEIDGHGWEAGLGQEISPGQQFENQGVALRPPVRGTRAQMIRSSRWSSNGRAQVTLAEIPVGDYQVCLYVWEDNDSQRFDVRLNDELVARDVESGSAGHWQRLGPWPFHCEGEALRIEASGGHANLSGLEVWRGVPTPESAGVAPPTPPIPAATRDARVAQLLARHCLDCHNESTHEGGLDLTRRAAALRGGEHGPALRPGDVGQSLLWRRVAAGEMPPEERPRLSDDDRELLQAWLAADARWSPDPIDPFLITSDHRAGYNWWSLQPVTDVSPPTVQDSAWPRNPIDQFVLAGLERQGLAPAPPAERRELIRRVTFDLIGLPPTPAEVAAFLGDEAPRAYERLVDRLLDSPHYGERWARHWLDIVRYGESQGFERNKFRESVWKYRDFVVEAFNSDLPYDEFVRWQLAGDVLRPDDPLAVIASGFLALGPYDLTAYNNGTAEMRAFAREEELEGLVGTVGQTFLGLTLNCARCHEHKFDPITQREYYEFSAALGGTYQGDERESLSGDGRADAERRRADLHDTIVSLREQEDAAASSAERSSLAAQRSRWESVERLLLGGPVHTTTPRQPEPWYVLRRGDFRQPDVVVAPRGVAAVSGPDADWGLAEDAPERERRRALANWITDPRNPLTPRVIVNRLWAQHFGRGLVDTPSDFGFQGGRPSHPELLDWLAGQLLHPESGEPWRLKQLQRLMVTSATYRQSSRPVAAAAAIDADNRWLWRQAPRRLEAEMYRDAVLAVSGELDPRLGGPGYKDYRVSSAGNNETYTVFVAVGGEFNRRSLYRTAVRAGGSPLLDILDCPDPSVATPRRSATSTPLQALTLLNDEFVEHYAAKFAERVTREAPAGAEAQVGRAYALAFGRAPDAEETRLAQTFVAERGLTQLCVVLLNTNEFLYVD